MVQAEPAFGAGQDLVPGERLSRRTPFGDSLAPIDTQHCRTFGERPSRTGRNLGGYCHRCTPGATRGSIIGAAQVGAAGLDPLTPVPLQALALTTKMEGM